MVFYSEFGRYIPWRGEWKELGRKPTSNNQDHEVLHEGLHPGGAAVLVTTTRCCMGVFTPEMRQLGQHHETLHEGLHLGDAVVGHHHQAIHGAFTPEMQRLGITKRRCTGSSPWRCGSRSSPRDAAQGLHPGDAAVGLHLETILRVFTR